MVLPVTVEGLTANADGLYRLTDIDARMAKAMAEYDAIEDETTDIEDKTSDDGQRPMLHGQRSMVNGPAYTLDGKQANDSTRGIVIENNTKYIRR